MWGQVSRHTATRGHRLISAAGGKESQGLQVRQHNGVFVRSLRVGRDLRGCPGAQAARVFADPGGVSSWSGRSSNLGLLGEEVVESPSDSPARSTIAPARESGATAAGHSWSQLSFSTALKVAIRPSKS